MECQNCGKAVTGRENFCPDCGARLRKRGRINLDKNPAQKLETINEPGVAAKYRPAVRGWLLVFVVLFSLGLLVESLEIVELIPLLYEYPSFKVYIYINLLYILVFDVWGGFCIYKLCVLDRLAVRYIKIFLALRPLLVLGLLFFCKWYLESRFSLRVSNNLIPAYEITRAFSGTFVFSVVWYWYFSVSRRIKSNWPLAEQRSLL